jgi:hypothetical protein
MANPPRRRSPGDQHDASRGKSLIGALLIASVIALLLIVYVHYDRSTSAVGPQSLNGGSAPPSSPRLGENPPAVPNARNTPQTGSLETKAGGAPADSPQGDTPAGMQSTPSGSSPRSE